MRPINLIPEEQRRRTRGAGVPSGNPLAFLVVGALAILLVGVVMLVLTSNQVSDRESEVATLQAEKAAAAAEAAQLTPYASFQQVAEQRTATIAELANSRFDWVRVMRQLSLTLPPDVFFTNLSGSAGGGEGGITGPSLTIAGCAPGQDDVAGFVASLKQIDGVTRVELKQSVVGETEGQATGASICSVGHKAQFNIIVAFDAAPPSPDSGAAIEAAPTEGETEEGSTEGTTESGSTEEGGSASTETETTPAPSSSATESTSASTADTSVGTG